MLCRDALHCKDACYGLHKVCVVTHLAKRMSVSLCVPCAPQTTKHMAYSVVHTLILDVNVLNEPLLLGQQESNQHLFITENPNSAFLTFVTNVLVICVSVAHISQRLTRVLVCMSTGQYSRMMGSPTSSNWPTQEVRRTVAGSLEIQS